MTFFYNENMDKKLNLEKLYFKLEALGLNQAQLAKRLGFSREIVSQWLKGNKMPRPDKLLKLGLELGLSFEELVIRSEHTTDPIIAFRKKGRRLIRNTHIECAKKMGRSLESLVEYLPCDRFEQPPTLRKPVIDYHYIQKVSEKVRKEIGVRKTGVVNFHDLINKFNDLQATIIPVLWGEREKHENALHVYLPSSGTTWIYLNLDSNAHDFKFWMAHELGHVYAPALRDDEGEDFADMFAQALLFPKECAKNAYNELISLSRIGTRVNRIKEFSEKNDISPITVYNAINGYAQAFSFKTIKINSIFAAATKFNKQYLTISEDLFGENNGNKLSPKEYIRVSKETFESQIFDILRICISQEEKPVSFVQNILGIPLLDAKGIYEELC